MSEKGPYAIIARFKTREGEPPQASQANLKPGKFALFTKEERIIEGDQPQFLQQMEALIETGQLEVAALIETRSLHLLLIFGDPSHCLGWGLQDPIQPQQPAIFSLEDGDNLEPGVTYAVILQPTTEAAHAFLHQLQKMRSRSN